MSPWIKGYDSWYLTINCKVILGHFGYINKISQNLRACCLIFQMNCFPVTCWDSLLMGSMFLMNSVPNGRKNGVILSWWGRWTNILLRCFTNLHQPLCPTNLLQCSPQCVCSMQMIPFNMNQIIIFVTHLLLFVPFSTFSKYMYNSIACGTFQSFSFPLSQKLSHA